MMHKLNITQDVLYKLYIVDDLTCDEIANVLNTSSASVSRYCYKFGIRKEKIHIKKKRIYTKPFKNNKYTKIYKEELIDLYINKHMSIFEIANFYKVSTTVIKKALKYNNIKKSQNDTKATRQRIAYEKYGVDHFSKTNEFKRKLKETNLNHCGYESNFQDPAFKEHSKKMFLSKYGVINPIMLKETRDKVKQTCLERYGVENPSKSKEIQEKIRRTTKERYGVEWYSKSDEFKTKIEQTHLKNCGETSNFKTKEFREESKRSCLQRYGVDSPMKSEQIRMKAIISKKENGTFVTSSKEEKINEMLYNKFHNIIRQYTSEVYPFACDFYIPEKDLYIEYQGHFSHGCEPFDPNNINHTSIVEKWKEKHKDSYDSAIQVWTIRDPLKRETAKKNNLNWIEFFTMEEFMEWYNEN